MHPKLGAFRAALLTGWIGLSTAGWLYARQKNIPLWAALPLIAAFLLEYSFYLVPGIQAARARLRERFSRGTLALAMALSAVAPYLVYSLFTGQFTWVACVSLAAIVAAVSFWYMALRPSPVTDVLFLVFLAAIVFSRVFNYIYASPIGVRVDILGKLMLIRTGALAALELRRVEGIGFGFIPSQKEWITGVRYFFYFLPVGFPLALALGLVRLNFTGFLFWQTLAIFCGALWVLALSEEFFFRGLLQQWMTAWTARPNLALIATSLLFGAAHLPFRAFPNWSMAAVAAVAGCFYGIAYRKTGSIRASMVTHALVVTAWRTFFVS
jgi:membrane protease YdiL (CAAX protease family)